MRVGDNPGKINPLIYKKGYHRIIIPVYIGEGAWFATAFETLQLCLESLFQTILYKTVITVIANCCSDKVLNYLKQKNNEGQINTLLINHENQGKVDTVVSVMKGCRESLITVSDCDVLFKAGWQKEIEKIFTVIPRCGMVSPMPAPSFWNSFTSWSWYFGFVRGKIKRESNHDFQSIKLFRASTGTLNMITQFDENPFYLYYKNIVACFGSGHFCSTYNRNVVDHIPMNYSGNDINNAELQFLDLPVENGGFLRLSTAQGHVYHMGNVAEDWMYKIINENEGYKEQPLEIVVQKGYLKNSSLMRKTFSKILRNYHLKMIKVKLVPKNKLAISINE